MAASETEKRDLVGHAIFDHVIAIVGEETAPKVTGMIINLTMDEMHRSISLYETLVVEAKTAADMLKNSTRPQIAEA
jgi:hypothetical protein